MTWTILLVLIVLVGLITLHEFGHFVFAKKFGVNVEEFGIGYPPRIFGRKFGETFYSLNLLPFGAFVKIEGEDGGIEGPHSFGGKPIWQRALILFGGVATFWLVSIVLFSLVMTMGVPSIVNDSDSGLIDPKVQVVSIASGSPAEESGIEVGDAIKAFSTFSIDKVKQVQELSEQYKGEEIVLTIERGEEIFDVSLMPRVSFPGNEGPIGVGLVRTSIKSYPWYTAIVKGVEASWNTTITIISSFGQLFKSLFVDRGLPPGVQVLGPIGVISMMTQAANLGLSYFLQFIALISIYLAVFNTLPIPALDGGRLLFLGIEKIRRKPLDPKVEQKVNAIFFFALLGLIILVTIKDIIGLF